jgi:hypothetical protein
VLLKLNKLYETTQIDSDNFLETNSIIINLNENNSNPSYINPLTVTSFVNSSFNNYSSLLEFSPNYFEQIIEHLS